MTTFDKDRLLAFMRHEPYAVQASVGDNGTPQAAIVGVVVSVQFEVFFDTLGTSRGAANLRQRPHARRQLLLPVDLIVVAHHMPRWCSDQPPPAQHRQCS